MNSFLCPSSRLSRVVLLFTLAAALLLRLPAAAQQPAVPEMVLPGEAVNLKAVPELQKIVSGDFAKPTADDMANALRKETGLNLTLDESVIRDRVIQGATTWKKVPAWGPMEMLARNKWILGQWRKVGDEYRLFATYDGPLPPLLSELGSGSSQNSPPVLAARTVTSFTTPSLASGITLLLAAKKIQDKFPRPKTRPASAAKAPPPQAVQVPPPSPAPPLPNSMLIRHDPKLRTVLTFVEERPTLSHALQFLHETTGLTFTVADHLARHDPDLGSVQLQGAPAFTLMNIIAAHDLTNGRWEKVEGGYRLEGEASLREKPLPTPGWQNYRVALVAVVASLLGLTAVLLIVAWRRGLLTPTIRKRSIPAGTS